MRSLILFLLTIFGISAWDSADAAPPLFLPRQAASHAHVRFNAAQMLVLGHLEEAEVTFPDGEKHPLVVELVQSHGDGIHSWVGAHRDAGRDYRTIITTGPAEASA
jgi:hypothetical protein